MNLPTRLVATATVPVVAVVNTLCIVVSPLVALCAIIMAGILTGLTWVCSGKNRFTDIWSAFSRVYLSCGGIYFEENDYEAYPYSRGYKLTSRYARWLSNLTVPSYTSGDQKIDSI